MFGLLAIVAFAALAVLLTTTVTYHPFGVPEGLREKYHNKVAELERHSKLASQANEITRPAVVMNEKTFDFGMVDPHATISHSFIVRNQGELPLQLSVRETSCKCTVGELQNNLVVPGDQTTITMTWNTGYQADEYEQTALVATNDPLNSEIELKVKGVVRAECIAPENIGLKTADPGKPAESDFVVYSQLWDDFEVAAIETQLKGFQWTAEPVAPDDISLLDTEAMSAWRVRVSSSGNPRGRFSGKMKLTINPFDGSQPVTREVTAYGKVRAPISFISPDIHRTTGLDIGTLIAGKEYLFHLVVRSRSEPQRDIEVLGVKPDELDASIQPLGQPGSYKLTLRVPKDCPMVAFNANHKHGYVEVGDPDDKAFSNWFPVLGAVIDLDD